MPEDQLSPDELAAYAEAPPPAAQPAAPASDALSPDELAAYEAVDDPVMASAAVVPPPVDIDVTVQQPQAPPAVVPVIFPDGVTRGTVPATDVEQARLEGYTLVTPEMEAEEALQAAYGDTGGQVVAGIQGVGRGASLGLSDYGGRVASGLVSGLLGPDVPLAAGPGLDAPVVERGLYDEAAANAAAQETRDYQAANPLTATGAEIGGAILTAAATGGGSAATTGAGALARMTPAGRLASLGMKLGETLVKESAKRGLSAAGRIASVGAAAGLEGAADNAVRAVMDDFAQAGVDPEALDRVADRMTEAAWDGMVYSTLLGVGGSAVAEGFGRLRAGRAAKEVAEEAGEAAPPPMPSDVPPPEAVRPEADIAADLEVAQKRLDEAVSGGLTQGADEAADDLGRLMAEQEQAVMVREGLTPDAAIEATLKLEPSPEALSIIDRIDQNLNTSRNAKELELKFKDEADRLVVEMTRDADDMSRFKKNVVEVYANKSTQPKVVKSLIERDGVQWSPETGEKLLKRAEEIDAALEAMADPKKHAMYSKRQLGEIEAGRQYIARFREHMTGLRAGKAAEAGPIAPGARVRTATVDDMVEAHTAYDGLRGALGTLAEEISGRPPSPTEAKFQKLFSLIRADLQDPKIVGQTLATFQTAKNAAYTRAIRKGNLLRQKFSRAGSSEAGGAFNFGDVIEYDMHSIGGMVDALADPRGAKEVRDFVAGLTAEVELMETLGKYYPLPPGAADQIKAQRAMLERTKANLRAAKELAVKAAEAKRLASQTSVLQSVLDGIRGIPYGGAAFATLVGTSQAVARGLSSALVGLGKGAVKQEEQLVKAARAAVKNHVELTPAEARKARKPPRLVAANDPPHFAGVGMSAAAVQRAIAEAEALQTAESDESRALEQQLADIRDELPELADAVGRKVTDKAAFILSKLPPMDTADPFRQPRRMIDPMTERSIARYVSAARDPSAALERLAEGTGTKEDKEVLKQLYPQRYARFVSQVQAMLKETKRVPSPEQRQRLHFATGIPMSREQQPAYMLKRKASREAAAQQPDPQAESEQLKPMVTPANASTEFEADKRFASRTDQITGGADD